MGRPEDEDARYLIAFVDDLCQGRRKRNSLLGGNETKRYLASYRKQSPPPDTRCFVENSGCISRVREAASYNSFNLPMELF